jgi:hypothetical protein
MAELTKEQLDFLAKHNVSLKYVFDATGLSKTEYRPIMKELNKYIAFNVTPCNKSGHELRTRSGHCVQCNTAHLAFQKRNDSSGITYIAGSINGEVIKVGFTKAVEIRSKSLNRSNYAGYNDWEILFAIESGDAGRIETKANATLYKYAYSTDYEHDGHWQDSHETYHCSYSNAKKIVLDICDENDYKFEKRLNVKSEKYEFRNLLKL